MQHLPSILITLTLRLFKIKSEKYAFATPPESVRVHKVKVIVSDDVKGTRTLVCGNRRYKGDGGWEARDVGFEFDSTHVRRNDRVKISRRGKDTDVYITPHMMTCIVVSSRCTYI